MSIQLAGLEVLPQENDYWFMRTEGGKYFETFYQHGFIAIGWNEISLRELSNTPADVKSKIAAEFDLNLDDRYQKSGVTEIYNKMIRFRELRKFDIIVMPSYGSSEMAFGIVASDRTYEVDAGTQDCEYQKRRKVNWVKRVDFSELDNVFYKIRRPQHAISNINDYMEYIDSVMYDVYQKDDYSHFIVRVKLEENINLKTLATVLQDMHDIMGLVNEAFGLHEDIDDSYIQIALQSPGFFNLKQRGVSLILLALVLGSQSCEQTAANLSRQDRTRVQTFKAQNQQQLDTLHQKLDTLNVHL